MDNLVVFAGILVLAVGALCGFFIGRRGQSYAVGQVANMTEQMETSNSKLEASNAEKVELAKQYAAAQAHLERIPSLETDLKNQSDDIKKLTKELQSKSEALLASNKDKERISEMAAAKEQELSERQELLKQEIEAITAKGLKRTNAEFAEQSKASLDALMQPLKQRIEAFTESTEKHHKTGIENASRFDDNMKKMAEAHSALTKKADTLANALTRDPKARGNWGEQALERILQIHGMKEGREYSREQFERSEEGRAGRMDFVLHLPDKKAIILDSKVTLNDYVQMEEAGDDEAEFAAALKRHTDAVKGHVKELSKKNYSDLLKQETLSFVIMFMPIEGAFHAAVEADTLLQQNALKEGVFIATPNTLMPLLSVLSYMWSINDQNANAKEIATLAGKVYDKLNGFIGNFTAIKSRLQSGLDAYEKAYGQLTTGPGNAIRSLEKMSELGVPVKKLLPEDITAAADRPLAAPAIDANPVDAI